MVEKNVSNEKKVLKASSPEEIFQKAKIDYTNLVIGYYDNINFDYGFPVTPDDYLRYAQSDFKEGQERGRINALSNAKRCIDCLIETVLKSLGIAPHKIPNNALKFCDEVLHGKEKSIMPLSLRLFCALGLAPSFLISEVRLLRNKVEHEYEIPESDDVLRAIEVADLLLNNIKAKESYSATIDITDVKRQEHLPDTSGYITGIYFNKNYDKKGKSECPFNLSVSISDREELEYSFKGDEFVLFFLLKAMFIASHDETSLVKTIKLMLQNINIKTPKEHIDVVQVHR